MDVLFSCNEKFEAAALSELMPPSIISSQWPLLLAFGQSEGRTVLKPLHQAQSQGVELLDWRTSEGIEEAKQKISQATSQMSSPILLQRYLEGILDEGETRLWFLDGCLLASVKKLPLQNDFRVNIDQGSPLAPHSFASPQETRMVQKIGKHLKERKIRLAAIDLIEGNITDFNFTSPGLITQMEQVLKRNLAFEIIKSF
jgi:glutathione synthase/RimK-type ligase-like ATP-grasp enzyme